MIPVLLRPGLIAARRFFSLRDKDGRLRLALGLGLGSGVGALVFYFTYRALEFFSGVELIGLMLTARLLEFTLLGVLGFVFLSSVVSALATFYLTEDLTLIRAAPVDEGRFFMSRWLQTTVLSSWMVLGFSVPLLAAYGYALGTSWQYGVAAVAGFVPLLLIPSALATILITLLVCVFPARRVRDLFVVLGVVTAGLLLLLLRVAQPERLMRPEVFGSVANYVAAFEIPQSALLPSAWTADLLRAAQVGSFEWEAAAMLWAAVWGLGSAAYLVHRRLYRLAYSRAQEGGAGAYGGALPLERLFEPLHRRLPPFERAFARKDLKLFLRDPGQWAQLLILLTLVVAYVYNYAVYPGADVKIAGLAVNHLLGVLNLILAGFVVAALVARFAFPAVSIEGRAFWLVRTAPVAPSRFIRAKFLLALGPLLPIALLLVALTAYWLELDRALVAISVVHIALLTTAMTGLGLGLGALYPRFKFENPAQVPMSFGGIVFMLTATAYTIVTGIATAWLAAPLAFEHLRRPLWITLLSWSIWLTFHMLHAIIPLRFASRALARKEYL